MRRLSLLLCALALALAPIPARASADPIVAPVAVSNSLNTLDVYEIIQGDPYSAYVKSWNGGWSSWSRVSTVYPPFGISILGNTATLAPGDNIRWGLFSDQNLYCQANPSVSWVEMTILPIWTASRAAGTPAILKEPSSRARLVGVDQSNRILSGGNYLIGSGCNPNQLGPFSNTGGLTFVSPAIAGTSESDYLLAATGTDGTAWWSYNGSQFQQTSPVRSTNQTPCVTTWGSGRYDLFVVGPDQVLYHQHDNPNPWERLGGGLLSGVGCTSWGYNRIDVFGVGLDYGIWHIDWNGAAWSAWEPLGTA